MKLLSKSMRPYSEMTLEEVIEEMDCEYNEVDICNISEEEYRKGFDAGSNVSYDGVYDDGYNDAQKKYKDAIKRYLKIEDKLKTIKESYDEIKEDKEEIEELFGIELLSIE